jgi:hypothetical protein
MAADFNGVFNTLKPVLSKYTNRLAVKTDTPDEYILVTKSPSPLPQHKGQPMWFGAVKKGKAYVSIHLMPLYMNTALVKSISPELRKRMQGKTCFNFKAPPAPALLEELSRLTELGLKLWNEKQWL